MITAVLDQARAIGLSRIELTVRESNLKAISLYKSLNFEIEGVHKKAVFVDGKYEIISSWRYCTNSKKDT